MKSFKTFISETKKEEKKSSDIPHPIHFKHIPSEEDKHQTPHPIHFKHIPSKEDKKLDEFFNWFKSKKPKETPYSLNSSLPSLNEFKKQNLNSKLGSTPSDISDKLHSDNSDIENTSVKTLRAYSGDKSYEMNKHLVESKGIVHNDHMSLAGGIDRAIQQNKIKRDLHTYSGVAFDPRKHLDENGRMRSPAYISSSHDPNVAHAFASSKTSINHEKHIIHFHLKSGDPAVHLGKHSNFPDEYETVVGRGAVLQHHGTTEYQDKKNGQKYIIHHMTIHRTPEHDSLYSKIKKANA